MMLLQQDASPRTLRVVTWGVFGLWFIKIVFAPLHHLAMMPLSLYQPVGFLHVLPKWIHPWLVSAGFLAHEGVSREA